MLNLNNKKHFLVATTLFVVAQIILSIFIQKTGDITYGILTVSSVTLACVFVILNYKKSKFGFLMIIALINTVIADTFLSGLAVFGESQFVAMCFFVVVQACYFLIIYDRQNSQNAKIAHLIIRIIISLIAVVLTIVVLGDKVNGLVIITMLYFANLLLNLIYSFIQIKKSILLPIGLFFFVLCDICIGLHVIDTTMMTIPPTSILYPIVHSGINLAWAFYVPCLTLLALSVKEKFIINKD